MLQNPNRYPEAGARRLRPWLTRLVAGYATAPVEALVEAVEMDAVERAGRRRPDDLAVVAVRVLA